MILLLYRMREQLGVVRVSTAYEFFEAVEKHVIFNPRNYYSRAKGPYEATSYDVLYVAANEDDEKGKLRVSATLDRTQMWNCTELKGCKDCHEFVGLESIEETNVHSILMRKMPCPCQHCYMGFYNECVNIDVVGTMGTHQMIKKDAVDCPEFLTAPLDNYKNGVLKAFIIQHAGNFPKGLKVRKAEMLRYIALHQAEYVVDVPNPRQEIYDAVDIDVDGAPDNYDVEIEDDDIVDEHQ